jgi:hypothetical protein
VSYLDEPRALSVDPGNKALKAHLAGLLIEADRPDAALESRRGEGAPCTHEQVPLFPQTRTDSAVWTSVVATFSAVAQSRPP